MGGAQIFLYYGTHDFRKTYMSDKVQFELEFAVNSSPTVLFSFLSTPSGLSEWFCDDVNSRGELFTFFWEGSEESAKMLSKKNDQFVKFRWLSAEEEGEKTYFEFRIVVDDLTGDVSLIITDFAEEDEVEESKLLWNSQISDLFRVIGA
ncbi:MAG: Uncharacterised protein [Flavobacteriia bacterium]|nr:MAG: Uncharacterised protein [Flavobacteriia bacterium]